MKVSRDRALSENQLKPKSSRTPMESIAELDNVRSDRQGDAVERVCSYAKPLYWHGEFAERLVAEDLFNVEGKCPTLPIIGHEPATDKCRAA